MSFTFKYEAQLIPSRQLERTAGEFGVCPDSIMRDYIALPLGANALHGTLRTGSTFAVGDMANNLQGTSYVLENLAVNNGLPRDYKFNGGLVASLHLREVLLGREEMGAELVEVANQSVADLYSLLNMEKPIDPVERFTGYLTHVNLGEHNTTLTSVGM